VAIVSRASAARYWPFQDPLGSRVTIRRQQWTVVGVVEDVPTHGLDVASKPVVYVPIDQWPARMRGMRAVVRTAGDPAAVIGAVRAAMAEVSKDTRLEHAVALFRRDVAAARTSMPMRPQRATSDRRRRRLALRLGRQRPQGLDNIYSNT